MSYDVYTNHDRLMDEAKLYGDALELIEVGNCMGFGCDPDAPEIGVYKHHVDTVRAQMPDASDERVMELACKLAITEWQERE